MGNCSLGADLTQGAFEERIFWGEFSGGNTSRTTGEFRRLGIAQVQQLLKKVTITIGVLKSLGKNQ